ncbi:hypothetical protein SGFS_054330 [Streptomyces graminofaciens]|uniref:Matrixin n=1 Tax=Streptomyces graminofaciens TaxID=68212 RepID=A0ABM8HLB8_9ACTN|nr:hypothetical protein [Streptomyces graminofaciens]BBC34139.1 hypothetical protein SGFS_054330 [Streptomyces graminofaciens]
MYVRVTRSAKKMFTVAAMVGSLFTGTVFTAQAASFDNMFKTENADWDCSDGDAWDEYCRTDNGYLTFAIEPGMTDTGDADVRASLREEYGPTDLEVHEHTGNEIEYDGSSETDIIFDYNDPSLPAGILGIAWCNDATSDYECDQHYVSFDNSNSDPWKAVVCHETGHAVGLTHGHEAYPRQSQKDSDLGCMRTEGDEYDTPSWTDLGSHNVGEINDIYVKP